MLHAPRSRIPLAGVALLAGAVAIVGCSSAAKPAAARRAATTHASSATSTKSATSTIVAPAQRPPTRAQALAFVHRVRLRASDLPGFTAKRESQSKSKEGAFTAQFDRCAEAHLPARGLAEASSPGFERKSGGIHSELVRSFSAVAPSERIARRELAVIDSSRGRACLDRDLVSGLAAGVGHQASLGAPSVRTIKPAVPGVSATFGWQVTVSVSARGITLPVHMSLTGFQDGQGEALLAALSLPEPLSTITLERLLSALAERAKASRL